MYICVPIPDYRVAYTPWMKLVSGKKLFILIHQSSLASKYRDGISKDNQ